MHLPKSISNFLSPFFVRASKPAQEQPIQITNHFTTSDILILEKASHQIKKMADLFMICSNICKEASQNAEFLSGMHELIVLTMEIEEGCATESEKFLTDCKRIRENFVLTGKMDDHAISPIVTNVSMLFGRTLHNCPSHLRLATALQKKGLVVRADEMDTRLTNAMESGLVTVQELNALLSKNAEFISSSRTTQNMPNKSFDLAS